MANSIYRLRLQDVLMLSVGALLCLGVVMVNSAAATVTGQEGFSVTNRGLRHLIYAATAFITLLAVGKVDYRRVIGRDGAELPAQAGSTRWAMFKRCLRKCLSAPAFWFMVAAIIACVMVLVPGIGRRINGARRWLSLGFTYVQPSEIAKWATVVFLAWWFTARPFDIRRFFGGFVLTFVPVGIVCLLVVKEDFGTAALIGLCALAMCLAGGVKWWHVGVVLPPAIAAGVVFILIESYRIERVLAFLDPWKDPQGEGYHMIQSLLAYCSGGLFGTGLGRGIQKLGYLPEDTTDFIFAVICEELGLMGALLTTCLYVGILYVAWQIIRRCRDPLACLLAFGTAAMTGLQALINVAVATVSVPPKGLSLPLVSAGGSGLVITCATLGLLLNVAKQVDAQILETATDDARRDAGRTSDGNPGPLAAIESQQAAGI